MAESVVTTKAKEKMVKARAGVKVLPKIAGMAFGSGAVSSSGAVIAPTAGQTALKNELLRKPVDNFVAVSSTCYRYKCTLEESELAGKDINEIALYDAENDLVAIKTFRNKGKDDDMEMIFEIDDTF